MLRKISAFILFTSLFMACQQSNELKTSEYSDVINQEITGKLAYETTAFVADYWRVVGNTGFNKSVYRIAEQLEKDGYVLEENATEKDVLTYRIETRPLKRPTWESVDATVTTCYKY
jgi:aminopeptidase YwaD